MSYENPRKRGLGGFGRGRGGAKRARGAFNLPKHSLPRDECENLRLTEKDIGITEYISKYPGFNGVIKQRFSDFLVNELKPDGTEVHLSDTNPPAPPEDPKPSLENMTDILPKETWDEITALLDQPGGNVEIKVNERSKDERRTIHNIVKKVYGHSLDSNTSEKNGDKFITVSRPNKDSSRRRGPAWPFKNEYVHFALYKENMDTMEAVNLLSHKLSMKPSLLSYAGTKDRRAKTCQRMCVKKVDPTKISSAARTMRGLAVGDFEFCDFPLTLGKLAGNRFQIVLRNVTARNEQVDDAMTSLRQNGFLNYYGLQRFGTQSVPTHHIGRALLQGDWQQAVELILKPRGPGESPKLQEMRKLWWKTRDAGRALKMLHSSDKCIEGQLLHGLIKSHKNDLISALEFIPRNARLMYLHAYQSFIWNQVLSRRVQEFGLKAVPGDLVLAEDAALLDTADPVVVDPEDDAEAVDNPNPASRLPAVKVLTEADVESYSLHDVVLPLPGHEVTYPNHAAAQWYEELMAKDNLSSAALKQNIRKYTLAGTYRKITVLPTNVSWQIKSYSDATKPLVLSDLDIVQKKSLFNSDPDGAYKALVLDFCLPSSAYATMALREVLKCDTSARHQATLNSYAKPDMDISDESTATVVKSEVMDTSDFMPDQSNKSTDVKLEQPVVKPDESVSADVKSDQTAEDKPPDGSVKATDSADAAAVSEDAGIPVTTSGDEEKCMAVDVNSTNADVED